MGKTSRSGFQFESRFASVSTDKRFRHDNVSLIHIVLHIPLCKYKMFAVAGDENIATFLVEHMLISRRGFCLLLSADVSDPLWG